MNVQKESNMENQILFWDKPAKLIDQKEHNETYMFDGGVPGAYVPNMSKAGRLKWKAKLVGVRSATPTVEIRKEMGSNVLIKVTKNTIKISTNGPFTMDIKTQNEFNQAIQEARLKLQKNL